MATARSELQKQARNAVLQQAFFRWESAVVLGGMIVLTVLLPHPFVWWPVWGWPLLGLAGLVALVFTNVTNAEANVRQFLERFHQEFDPTRIRDGVLRQDVEAALEYQHRIEVQAVGQRSGALRNWLEGIADQFYDWIGGIYELAVKLDAYRHGELLAHGQQAVPQRVEEIAARRRLERDPVIRRELDAALEVKGKQWQALRDLNTRMEQVNLGSRESIAALAAIHSQVQHSGAADIDSGRADRLEADIREQVDRLEDLISSIHEILNVMSVGDSGI